MTDSTTLAESGVSSAPAPGRAGAGSTSWNVVFLLMAIAMTAHFNRLGMASAGNARLMSEYGISPVRMGLVYSAFLLAYTIFMIPGGWFIDRFSPRKALMVVCLGSAVFVALTGVIGLTVSNGLVAFWALLVVRAMMGTVSSPLHPGCASAVSRWVAPGIRSWANGLVTGAALVGIALTPPGFGAMIDVLTWPVAFLVASVVTVGVGLAWTLYTAGHAETQPVRRATSSELVDWRSMLTDRSLIFLTLSYGAVSYFQYLFFYWMDYYFQTVLKLPESTSRAYAAMPPLAMAVGMPLGGWLSDRIERSVGARRGRRVIPMLGMLAGAGLLFLGQSARDPVWVVVWFSLALGSVGLVEGPFWATATELGGRRAGSAAALINTGGNGFGQVAPWLTPLVGGLYGWGAAVALGAIICLAGLVVWVWIEPPADADPSGQPA